jgi:3-oxoisoapionate kinase
MSKDNLLLSYYGDDLTGSTDAMEALTLAGVRTVLFLRPATDAQLDTLTQNRPLQAIGLAGTSRSETPEWMDQHLPPAFDWLKRQGAAICHYKVCSTFDSAPEVGNIGRALEIGAATFEQAVVPIVVGVPQLRRYTVFGNLFATIAGETYRIDRHPVMSRHPVTPMHEADLRLHLAAQTTAPVGLVDGLTLQSPEADAAVDKGMESEGAPVRGLLLDVADTTTQTLVGQQLWRHRRENTGLFTVGSSGVEYALVKAWQASGLLTGDVATPSDVGAVDRIAVVSGSCSAITAQQIRHAGEQGFALIAVNAARLASRSRGDGEQAAVLAQACAALDAGRSVIAYTALGPETAAERFDDAEPHAIGRRLGRLLRDMVEHGNLQRVVVAGGDTSSHALRELDVFALTVAMPLPRTPGSPLCFAHSENPALDGTQVALKGGQIGAIDYFAAIRDGRR